MMPAQLQSGPEIGASRPGSRVHKPIALPTTNARLGSPFLRAYPPLLAQYGLSKEDFLGFLDSLNRIAVASPPIRVLGLVGSVVSFVPLSTTQIVGNVVRTAADVATYGISKGRTEMCLREANENMFGPRGLTVEIVNLDALAKLTGMPILDAVGKVEKRVPILDSLEDISELDSQTVQLRRLRALEPWIETLNVEQLPQIEVPTNMLSKISAASSERQRRRGEEGLMKSRHKAFEDYEKDRNEALGDYEEDLRKLEKDEEKARARKPEKQDKKLRKVEEKREKAKDKLEKELQKAEKDRVKHDKEEKTIRKVLWLLIRDVDI